jgi:phosphopantothenoylcysteine decarboxylase/phosphopantothenate--cysteine ligase
VLFEEFRTLSLAGKRVLLVIGGGIAAYKTLELIRQLQERGAGVRAILTEAGAQFVTPLSVASLTADRVYQNLFDLTQESEMGHIVLSRSADLVVVAPATADLIAKMAAGIANDLATTALLATDKRVLIAPAMNVKMWEHAATRRNIDTLKADGIAVVGPNVGELADGEFGAGRLAEPAEIVVAIEKLLNPDTRLSGLKALVTAGPTHEPLDPVRYIANRSSGKQGYAIAAALADAGAETVLISGPVELAPPPRTKLVRVETARQMWTACEAQLPADIAVCSAAVADWRPETAANSKLKKRDAPSTIKLAENPDILAGLAHHAKRPPLVVGFAAETDDLIANASAKRIAKGCDWIVANDVSAGVMGSDKNRVHIITAKGADAWPEMSKSDVARRLVSLIADTVGKRAA